MGKFKIKRIVVLTVLILIILVIISITRLASEQSSETSNMNSGKIVNFVMESMIKMEIPINREDVFWRVTANTLVRKAAHFVEYFFLGLFLSLLLNLITKKIWISLPAASVICFVLAYLDEYRQQFVEGRGATWLDVRIDTYGALTAIILVTISFVFYHKFQKLKTEIHSLEEELGRNLTN